MSNIFWCLPFIYIFNTNTIDKSTASVSPIIHIPFSAKESNGLRKTIAKVNLAGKARYRNLEWQYGGEFKDELVIEYKPQDSDTPYQLQILESELLEQITALEDQKRASIELHLQLVKPILPSKGIHLSQNP